MKIFQQIKIGDKVIYLGEWENCRNVEYEVVFIWHNGLYFDLKIVGEYNILSGVYKELNSVHYSEISLKQTK